MADTSYWAKRNLKAQRAAAKKTQAEIEKQLGKYYASSMERVISDFEGVYNKLIADIGAGHQPTPADLYKLEKYWQMQGQLQNELEKLGNKSTAAMQQRFVKQYKEIYDGMNLPTGKGFNRIDRGAAAQMINSVWCADGKDWSSRVWSSLDNLRETLNENLIYCVTTGKKPTELKELLKRLVKEDYEKAYYAADRIVRTETAHIQTQAAQQRYNDYGIKEVEMWADPDERTCEVCGKLHKKRYPVNATMPVPAHPNCRCTIIPVIDDIE
jgi:SPP1 gp7 family putative phage head morphogenesis protein